MKIKRVNRDGTTRQNGYLNECKRANARRGDREGDRIWAGENRVSS